MSGTISVMQESGTKDSASLVWASVLVVVGLLVSLVLGHGFELQGMARGGLFYLLGGFVGLFGLCSLTVVPWRIGLLLGLVSAGYFAIRAALSPVWDLARADLILISCSWVTVVLVACMRPGGRAFRILLGGLSLGILVNAGFAFGQVFIDANLRLFNVADASRRAVGVMGHANSLGGFLAVASPLILGVCFSVKSRALRGLLFFVFLLGCGGIFCSQSRGALLGLGAGVLSVLFFGYIHVARKWDSRKSVVCGVLLILAGAGVVLAGVFMVDRLSEKRGHGTGFEQILSKNGRLDFIGLAVEQWFERPALGWGSRSYSYESNRRWEFGEIPSWIGSAEMVHSEYLQVLADYGLVGLVTLLAFVLGVSLFIFSSKERSLIDYGALGGLLAAMVHGFVDFAPHVLPVAVLIAICLGILLRERRPQKARTRDRFFLAIGMAGSLAILVVTCFQNWMTAPRFFQLERSMQRAGSDGESMELMKEILEASPDHQLARMYGRLCFQQYESSDGTAEELLSESLWGLALATERHPLDAESAGNYALALSRAGDSRRASMFYLRAIELAWRRERDFGLMGVFADFLSKEGSAAWHRREPELALEYFDLASAYLEASVEMRSRFRGKSELGPRRKWLREHIEFLEEAGITRSDTLEIPPPPSQAARR